MNELSDYGKVVLFNDGYALNDTADVLMTIIDGPGLIQILVYRGHFAGG
ncbi:hypothetical protein CLOBOL_03565 [Enterocloster bolteae ATCC BAA-613]|uniref:Uncharacterized protein n=1 Tax=Enterocloster bolteae (strain ATCC BAA-613 / DSM 15670 / CCUG 46953 / JCM 12243 / WAL 16351) TaxID=411902 RepID=A8RT67_ENTBW|nr:hypothetical protein CLOBOL_03565 [Enterocloster bolteae ATCC BAA-613]